MILEKWVKFLQKGYTFFMKTQSIAYQNVIKINFTCSTRVVVVFFLL